MNVTVIMAAVLADVIAGTGSARFVYGRLRAQAIEEYGLKWIDDEDAAFVVIIGTIATFVAWPLALLGFIIFGNPPKTAKELEVENRRQADYIAELERANGIGGQK